MKCIVLSGATVPFTELVAAITPKLVAELSKLGYTEVEVQYGFAKSAFIPQPNVLGYDFDLDIKSRIQNCQLVITHAGAGSILDSLDRSSNSEAVRKVLVVVNSNLMDNHQLELARKLDALNQVKLVEDPSYLLFAVQRAATESFKPVPPPVSLQKIIDEELKK